MTQACQVDLFVIGGGINGVGIARDSAGRGLSVALCEQGDLAEATSSRSSKMVHGGLRYLEYYEFRLVREALREREVLLRNAPHIIWPMRFVLPHSPQDRPAWLVRLGLFLYDHIAGRRSLPGTRVLDLRRDPEGAALQDGYAKAFEYSDCRVDDARLVALNALDAKARGALILPRTRCISARREEARWLIELEDSVTGVRQRIVAAGLVNAAGPWVGHVAADIAAAPASRQIRLVKGSHIIVPKFWSGEHAFLIQNHDRRVIFVIPYQGDLALIGTTDIAYDGAAGDVAIAPEEVDYLVEAVNLYFRKPIRHEDICATYSGVRALFDDGKGNPSAVTRDYVLDLDQGGGSAPLLNIFGGKITTFRELSERAMHRLKPFFAQMGGDWTADAPLPGGDLGASFAGFLDRLAVEYPWLPEGLRHHYARLYGTRLTRILGEAQSLDQLGRHFGGEFYEVEAEYLLREEWARTADDILWRRTKHGLHLSEEEGAGFASWLAARNPASVADGA
ncbi:MAG: glycerol-3-phosphate dehydrogenase [Paracoccus sp. (in: a-proteobacteria)]